MAADRADLRAGLHAMWDGVAPAWAEHADYADRRGAPVVERMIAAIAPAPGERALELACGPGGAGLALAPLVAPGAMVMSDISAAMIGTAAARAAARGLTNVEVRTLDLERIGESDAAYDLVVCREGLMLVLDPSVALAEMRRVLRPAGRMAVAVWGPRARNPWLGILLDAVSQVLGTPVPPPGVPGPFSLDDADRLRGLVAGAGFADAVVEEVAAPLETPSFGAWWSATTSLAGPIARRLAVLPDEARRAIRIRCEAGLRQYATDGALSIPAVTLVAFGRA